MVTYIIISCEILSKLEYNLVKLNSVYQGKEWLTYKNLLLIDAKQTKLKNEEDMFEHNWLQYRQRLI